MNTYNNMSKVISIPIIHFLIHSWNIYYHQILILIHIIPIMEEQNSKFYQIYFSQKLDLGFIDSSIVNGLPKKINSVSGLLKNMSSGYLYHYAFSIIFSLFFIFGIILMRVL
mgnify:CR=1 FL=1